MTKIYKPSILDRIYLKNPRPADRFNLAIEFITHHKGIRDEDCVRLIDLNTGEVIAESEYFADAYEIISYASALYSKHDLEYTSGWKKGETQPEAPEEPEVEYRAFKDIPIECQFRHIQSLALDLAHDMTLESGDWIKNPVLQATQDMNCYDYPCFYQEEDGNWELDIDVQPVHGPGIL